MKRWRFAKGEEGSIQRDKFRREVQRRARMLGWERESPLEDRVNNLMVVLKDCADQCFPAGRTRNRRNMRIRALETQIKQILAALTMDSDPHIKEALRHARKELRREIRKGRRRRGRQRFGPSRIWRNMRLRSGTQQQSRIPSQILRMAESDLAADGSHEPQLLTSTVKESDRIWETHFADGLKSDTEAIDGPWVSMMQKEVLEKGCEWKDITDEELRHALRQLKCGKGEGYDGVKYELLKFAGEHGRREMLSILNGFLRQGRWPEELRTVVIQPLYKGKGSAQDVANYRPIALQCAIVKLFERILMQRLDNELEMLGVLSSAQTGFRRKCGCELAVAAVYTTVRQRLEEGHPTSIAFMDIKSAYSGIDRAQLIRRLCDTVSPAMVYPLIALMEGGQARVRRWDGSLSPGFRVDKGLKQGSPLSPLLFNFVASEIDRRFREKSKSFSWIKLLWYADDLTVMASDDEELEIAIQLLRECIHEWGLTFSVDKCKHMRVPGTATRRTVEEKGTWVPCKEEWIMQPVTLDGAQILQEVEEFTLLGICLSNDLKWGRHKEKRERLATQANCVLQKAAMHACPVVRTRDLVLLWKQLVLSTLLYGIGPMLMTGGRWKKAEGIQRRLLKRCLLLPRDTTIGPLFGDTGIWPIELMEKLMGRKLLLRGLGACDSRGRPLWPCEVFREEFVIESLEEQPSGMHMWPYQGHPTWYQRWLDDGLRGIGLEAAQELVKDNTSTDTDELLLKIKERWKEEAAASLIERWSQDSERVAALMEIIRPTPQDWFSLQPYLMWPFPASRAMLLCRCGMHKGDNRWRIGYTEGQGCDCVAANNAVYSGGLHTILECDKLKDERHHVLHHVERVVSMLKQHPVLELQAGGETQQNGWNVILLGGKHLQTLLPRSQIGRVRYIEQDLVYKYFWDHVVPLLDGSTGQFS